MIKMKQCKSCSKEIAPKAKSCPGCGAKNKMPIYKRIWFWVIGLFIMFGVMSGEDNNYSTTVNNGTDETVQEISQNEKKEDDASVEEKAVKEVENNVPTEYKSALKKAKSYQETMAMSQSAIYDQLISEYGEKFTVEEAQYAIDNL